MRAEVGGPSVAEEGINLPTNGRGEGGGGMGGGDDNKEPGVVQPYRVLEGDRTLRGVCGVGEERLVHEDMINEGGAGARSSVGDGALRDGRDHTRSIKPLLKLVVPAGGRNVWGGPKGGVGVKVPSE